MLSDREVLSTIEMLKNEHLDVRTVTLGVSLFDCAGHDPKKFEENVQRKIFRLAGNLVKVCDEIGIRYGILFGTIPAWFQLLCTFPFFQGIGAMGLAPGKQPRCSYFFLHGGLGFFYRILALCDKGRLLKSGSPCFIVS